MESGVLYQEVALAPELELFLPRKGSNVYLLSGKKWRNIECGQIKEFKEIYYRFDLVLWDLSRVFDKINSESLAYTFPGAEIPSGIGIESFSTLVLATIGTNLADNESLLIRYNRWSKSFCCYKFAADTQQEFCQIVAKYAQRVYNAKNDEVSPEGMILNECEIDLSEPAYSRKGSGNGNIRFHSKIEHPSFGADSNFTSEQNYLIDRAIDAVERLQLTGLPMDLIKKLISVETRFSRIVITDKFRIFLADYNNKEVIMGPLPKVIFLFFLKHDREFMFSDLIDYKQELLEIYEKVSNRGDKEKMLQSIETLVDPTNNSICEKCTAVRKAFLEQITYSVARHYFIDGRQGMPKKIHLNRELVMWEGKI